MDLNPLHARKTGACGDGFLKHFAGGARRVRGHGDGDVVVLLDHLQVGAVAARGEDHAAAGEDALDALAVEGLHARDAAGGVTLDAHDLHVLVDRVACGLDLGGERTDVGVVRGDRRLAVGLTRPLAARIEAADADVDPAARHVEPRHVGLGVKPLHGGRGVAGHRENELGVVLAVTAHDRLKRKELGRVEDVLLASGVMLGELLENRLLKLGGLGTAGDLRVRVLGDDVAHSLRHRQKLFGLGIHGGHVAFGAGGVAAEHGHLLKDDHGRAVVDGRRGGNHAGAARTDDDHVGARLEVGGGSLVGTRLRGREELVGRAGLPESFGNGLLDGFGAHRGAADGVDGGSLGGEHGGGQLVDGQVADARSFGVLHDFDLLNLVGGNGHADGDVGIAALGRGFIGAGRHGGGDAGGKACGDECGLDRSGKDG